MHERELCLEEYISYLKQFTFADEHLNVTVNGVKYDIYCVNATEGSKIEIPLPTNYSYTITGDNMSSVIVVTEIGKA